MVLEGAAARRISDDANPAEGCIGNATPLSEVAFSGWIPPPTPRLPQRLPGSRRRPRTRSLMEMQLVDSSLMAEAIPPQWSAVYGATSEDDYDSSPCSSDAVSKFSNAPGHGFPAVLSLELPSDEDSSCGASSDGELQEKGHTWSGRVWVDRRNLFGFGCCIERMRR
mmetsp:Transcript_58099/g.149587  ORF Transcript_58099/g.149587 Transcript_58099/m.149587 type:complete len:167 (+) Transcript_58099:91-591(+)